MTTAQVKQSDLLKAVRKLGPSELDEFLEQALLLPRKRKLATLSAKESRLLTRINRGLPVNVNNRYLHLASKRKKSDLTSDQHAELLELTNEIESQDAGRAAALLELAKLRRVPLRILMNDMGIKAKRVRG